MEEYLETTVDKFTFKVARDRFYTRDGVWLLPTASPNGVTVRLGMTDYLQRRSGDAAFVNVKGAGTVLSVEDEFAEVETIKVNVALPSPIAGTIVDTNKALETNPELVNQDPYGNGWLVALNCGDWDRASSVLLNANAYLDFMLTEIGQELKEKA